MSTIVWTDGSAVGNGSADCRGGIGVFWAPDHPDNVSERYTAERLGRRVTNNAMELLSIYRALQLYLARYPEQEQAPPLTIISDSTYCINCFTKWCVIWSRNQWKTNAGKPIENQALIQDIYQTLSLPRLSAVKFVHCKSHMPEPSDKHSMEWTVWYGNKMADRFAKIR